MGILESAFASLQIAGCGPGALGQKQKTKQQLTCSHSFLQMLVCRFQSSIRGTCLRESKSSKSLASQPCSRRGCSGTEGNFWGNAESGGEPWNKWKHNETKWNGSNKRSNVFEQEVSHLNNVSFCLVGLSRHAMLKRRMCRRASFVEFRQPLHNWAVCWQLGLAAHQAVNMRGEEQLTAVLLLLNPLFFMQSTWKPLNGFLRSTRKILKTSTHYMQKLAVLYIHFQSTKTL